MDTQLEALYPERPRLKPPLRQRLKARVAATYRYDTLFWQVSLFGLWAVVLAAFTLTALGLPTGFGTAADVLMFTAGGTIAMAVCANAIALLLAIAGLPMPRLYVGAWLFTAGAVLTIFRYAGARWDVSTAVALFAACAGTLAGFTAGFLAKPRLRTRRRLAMSLLPAAACAVLFYLPLHTSGSKPAEEPAVETAAGSSAVIKVANPGLPGAAAYHYFTYGSGNDRHRDEFGKEAEFLSDSVDASAYISKWSKARTSFWGFDQKALPINGRVWMPEGSGPFPLILLVHGNHLMEDFSDEGYAYLGELLASRGFIAVSVDENFLNYSAWTGIPDNDMKVRAWLLLKHLQQIEQFADLSGTPFYNKVDFNRIGLVGHSRGGQAVAMAADPLRWFQRGDSLEDIDKFHIVSVAAIAPTDKLVDNNQARLSNVNYFSLQGAQDGDVSDFYGDRQYNRATFDKGASTFKATLYVEGANHSQFNTSWGHYDSSLPTGILLSRSRIMDEDSQRQIAKVYVSAFMEATLHGQSEYTKLFQDYRSGLDWLPDTSYFNRYEDGHFTVLADYEEDNDPHTIRGGGTAEARNVQVVEEQAKDRDNAAKKERGAVLEWPKQTQEPAQTNGQTRTQGQTPKQSQTPVQAETPTYGQTLAPASSESIPANEEPSYTLHLRSAGNSSRFIYALSHAAGLSFSMVNLNYQIQAADSPDISLELADADGERVKLPLTDFMPVKPLPVSKFTINSWLDNKFEGGKYKEATEAVFQTYRIDFKPFVDQNPAFNPGKLVSIAFYLGEGPGKVMLSTIGLYLK
ncbi:alpha/beta hydrolase family protein [Paenibacillus physcomitrellae]|uniref:Alpha/beta hydrolase n=1 Tax=Paenibacillus physcomitrellae TaxID=1619311 RepID=A0ABQ1FS82_9BACL|nr:hypothetical protein [Paenibacillus physcomitrellae]GGA27897.1 hypothetical protein GCM10010917_11050 [Paenibacillus physcomitrellae]